VGRNGHALKISVIGTGYLGLTHAVCLADLGHQVLAVDVDADKIQKAARGEAPFFEPGLEPLLRKNLDAGRLRFTGSFAAVADFDDLNSYVAYRDHPAHRAVCEETIAPIRRSRAAIQYEV